MKKQTLLHISIISLLLSCSGGGDIGVGYKIVKNDGGAALGYSPASGVTILEKDGLKFKDLNKNGILDPYEDWRLPAEERAKDLAKQMSVEQIAGLMLYSSHQSIPARDEGFSSSTYNGKPFSQSSANPWDLTDDQKKFLKDDNLRHVLLLGIQNAETAAKWNNNVQAYVESFGLGIPANNSSDPRHSAFAAGSTVAEFNASSARPVVSNWPDGLGMAATFDPALVKRFGEVASREYRALGITTALSPQIDLGTEPRWFRIGMTFGESPKLATDMARAYVDGFQTSEAEAEIKDGWGYHSVNAMAKHWPSGGPTEGGRDGHWATGKFAVYPGNNFETHLKVFTEGAFRLDGKTGMASAVMPYYTISYNQAKDGTNYANGYSKWVITDLLREKHGYDGVVCSDWGITWNEAPVPDGHAGKPWGVEKNNIAERHYIALSAGIDQFGGNNDAVPVLEAYDMLVKEMGEPAARARFEQSAVRLLKNIFRTGLFENPYLDPVKSAELSGNDQFVKEGYEAQIKSVVLLKNKNNVLPVKERKTVYIPKIYQAASKAFISIKPWTEQKLIDPVDMELVEAYYNVTSDPSQADFAIVFVSSPYHNNNGGGYDAADRANGGNGYVPIPLQYGPYTAKTARSKSIVTADHHPAIDPGITNSSYKDKTVIATNFADWQNIAITRSMMGKKPVIVVANLSKPMVFNEFEGKVDGIIARFTTSERSILDIISGKHEPSGLLPVQMPANMETVEKQFEDVPFDMVPHRDSEGNAYGFGYGLDWSGPIKDARTEKYVTNR